MSEKDPRSEDRRRATNLSLKSSLLEEARQFDINLSQAAQEGIEARVREARRAKWLAENEEAFEEYNRYVEKNGLPLARFRLF